MSGTISGIHLSPVQLTPGVYADPVTVTGVINVTSAASALYAATPWSIDNLGAVFSTGTGSFRGVFLKDGGYVLNAAGGTIEAALHAVLATGAAATVVNAGYISDATRGAVVLLAGGAITNASSGVVVAGGTVPANAGDGLYVTGGLGTIVNEGSVFADGAQGLVLYAGGVITNQVGGFVSAHGNAIYVMHAPATAFNAGTLIAKFHTGIDLGAGGAMTNEATGMIRAYKAGFYGYTTSSVGLTNYGTIISQTNFGARLRDGGTVFNARGALLTGAKNGVYAGYRQPTTVTNDGVVIGTTASGIAMYGGGTVSNAGTIAGFNGVFGTSFALTIDNTGTIEAVGRNNGIQLNAGGYVVNHTGGTIIGAQQGVLAITAAATAINAGLIEGASVTGVALNAGGLFVNEAGGVVVGAGLGAGFLSGSGTITNAGTINVTAGLYAVDFAAGFTDRLVVEPGAVFGGEVIGGNISGSTATSTLEFGAGRGTLAGIGSTVVDFAALTFDAGAAWLASGDAAGLAAGQAISGFAAGDTIEITGLAASYQAFSGGTLSLTGGTTLDLSGPARVRVSNSGGNTFITACFATGTRLLAEGGARAVETLRAGERLATASGRLATIRWVGFRRLDLRRHASPHDVMPVRVSAGALGEGLPLRDLVLSPDHAVLIDGALVPVRYLVNGTSITQETRGQVTYWHVELDRHDVVLAEGAPCESYLDTGNRAAFENAEGPMELHPDFARRVWNESGCAEILTDAGAARLRAIHTALAARGARARRQAISP